LTNILLTSRKARNVQVARRLCTVGSEEIFWNEFLNLLDKLHPDVLLCNHICGVGLEQEVFGLEEGKMVLIQTQMSRQIAVLRHSGYEEFSPKVEVISTYSVPERNELNYHAGAACRSTSRIVRTIQPGVQFCDENADIITADVACMNASNVCLSKVRVDVEAAKMDILQFMQKDQLSSICTTTDVRQFCKTIEETVELICFCLTPWIEGSTSKSIYQNRQKEFNVYNCCKCDNWYHKFCLISCGISLPKKNADFQCSACEVPDSVAWSHKHFSNTCTFDNFLTILLLQCRQHPQFLQSLGNSEVEKVLMGGMQLMINGHVYEGKTAILHYMASQC
jgi:hypothetical protein